MTRLAIAVIAACAASGWCKAAKAENWPTWRGPTSQGVSAEERLPLKWSATENVRWKVALPGPGNSTPIIWGDRVFITQASEFKQWPPKVPAYYAGGASPGGIAIAEKRSVMCFDRADGKLLWQRDTNYPHDEMTHADNPLCSASPVTDGERVIASHGPAGLVCYDLAGQELWKYEVGKYEHLWGSASSPILHGDLCIVWCGPGERQFLLAVNKKTGQKVWETHEPGGDAGITTKNFLGSWCTPIIVRVGDQDQLLFAVPHQLKGYDPQTGKELWSARAGGTYCYHSPLHAEGLAIYGADLLKLGGTGDVTKDLLDYRVGGMFISTAAIAGDYLYTMNDVGVPNCFQWQTGKELWKGFAIAPVAGLLGARWFMPPVAFTSPIAREPRASSQPDRSTSTWRAMLSTSAATRPSRSRRVICISGLTNTYGASGKENSCEDCRHLSSRHSAKIPLFRRLRDNNQQCDFTVRPTI